jgi:hypothetical protein
VLISDSRVIPFVVILPKLGEQNALLYASVNAISLINDLVSFSQAERRGFDLRLPLHKVNKTGLGTFHLHYIIFVIHECLACHQSAGSISLFLSAVVFLKTFSLY